MSVEPSNREKVDRPLEYLKIDPSVGGMHVRIDDIIADEQDRHQGRNGLDDLRSVPSGKAERFRIDDNAVIVPAHDHLDCLGRVFYCLNLIAIFTQSAVKAFY